MLFNHICLVLWLHLKTSQTFYCLNEIVFYSHYPSLTFRYAVGKSWFKNFCANCMSPQITAYTWNFDVLLIYFLCYKCIANRFQLHFENKCVQYYCSVLQTSLLTKEIKAILDKRPGSRSQREIEEFVHCMKRLVPAFRAYTYEQQKQICQLVMYDR